MTVTPMTSSSQNTNRSPILQKQKSEVQAGLKKALVGTDVWQPLEFKWYLRWKEYVNFDEDGPDLRSDEVRNRSTDSL